MRFLNANMTPEVQEFLNRKGRVKVAKPSIGGPSIGIVAKNFVEIFGCEVRLEGGTIKGTLNGREVVKQRSQKIKWTREVRQGMQGTIQHREHAQMLRDGEVGVGEGIIEMPALQKTGTEG